ncbi:glycerophosphoryl diester phosphodiesterase [Ereboglobus sp. PH5-10]|uniref:glycerophosphodiester phosphodiesterase family protein n=1 Tax=Ereboglobus sp. PH5-10 TaxID=2940629 RepID=UPI0024057425|nr:glycerophosphodiester phosphodiesterase family protein [Ereboglobus sp. PH5-10]MDF9826138.1 glycerophosphoryl diester phosphodiesterase [Ereboglobus sp. PH5-10]
MKKTPHIILTLALALMLGAALNAADRVDQLRAKLFSRDIPDVLVVAHRGDWRYAPENSMQGIERSISLGVDVVEVDLQRTKDGVLILMHDSTLERTTSYKGKGGDKGKVSEKTLEEIKKLTLKNGCGIRTKHKVPTLEELLVATKGRVLINLDKADRYFDEVFALLKKTGTTRQIIMKGGKPNDEVKRLYGAYLDEVIYMPIVNLDKPNAEQIIRDFRAGINPVAYELLYKHDTNPLPKKLARELKGNALIWYNTLWENMAGGHEDECAITQGPDAAYGYLIDNLGTRIIQTDRSELLLDYLKKRRLHD